MSTIMRTAITADNIIPTMIRVDDYYVSDHDHPEDHSECPRNPLLQDNLELIVDGWKLDEQTGRVDYDNIDVLGYLIPTPAGPVLEPETILYAGTYIYPYPVGAEDAKPHSTTLVGALDTLNALGCANIHWVR